jgi:hypothetical protein
MCSRIRHGTSSTPCVVSLPFILKMLRVVNLSVKHTLCQSIYALRVLQTCISNTCTFFLSYRPRLTAPLCWTLLRLLLLLLSRDHHWASPAPTNSFPGRIGSPPRRSSQNSSTVPTEIAEPFSRTRSSTPMASGQPLPNEDTICNHHYHHQQTNKQSKQTNQQTVSESTNSIK